MILIRQAVILAGGQGLRMKPFTSTQPKPLFPIHGKPFLFYLLEQLKEQGIEKVLLLLGYLPQLIQEKIGDGRQFGLQVEYSIADVETETGTRLQLAKEKLDPVFLLLYCDNYWPMNLKEMTAQFESQKTLAQITVYLNQDHYTKNNLRFNDDRLVTLYDKERQASDLKGVDIGYMLIRREVLDLLPNENVSFERIVLTTLAKNGQLGGYLTDHRYYSIGSPQRLPLTETFFKKKRAIILDRDGVLNKKAPEGHYVYSWKDFEWLPGSKEAVALLKKAGFSIFLVSNQAGIGRKLMKEEDLLFIHERMQKDLETVDACIDKIYYCPHHWEDNCECRKPKPGMLFEAQRDFHLDLTKTYFVGDDPRDGEAAVAAGMPFLKVSEGVSLFDLVQSKILMS